MRDAQCTVRLLLRSHVPKPRQLHDRFFKQAKAEGYVARSAYKLIEIQERYRVIHSGDHVLDLGCAPGSWLQVASALVKSHGLVVGIDLTPVSAEVGSLPQVVTMQGDIFKTEPGVLRAHLMGGGSDPSIVRLFDVVLSDMAPSTTGTPTGDHFRSVNLCRRVLDLLPDVLSPGGHLVMKVFEGEEYPALLKDTARLFGECKGLRPEATREVSREMFIIGKGYNGARTSDGRVEDTALPKPKARPKGWGAGGGGGA